MKSFYLLAITVLTDSTRTTESLSEFYRNEAYRRLGCDDLWGTQTIPVNMCLPITTADSKTAKGYKVAITRPRLNETERVTITQSFFKYSNCSSPASQVVPATVELNTCSEYLPTLGLPSIIASETSEVQYPNGLNIKSVPQFNLSAYRAVPCHAKLAFLPTTISS